MSFFVQANFYSLEYVLDKYIESGFGRGVLVVSILYNCCASFLKQAQLSHVYALVALP